MRLASLTRRTVAVTAAVALISSGALAASSAQAAGEPPIVTGAEPNAAVNSGKQRIIVVGSGFIPSQDTVKLVPLFAAAGQDPIAGTIDLQATGTSTSRLAVDFTFDLAAPSGGYYDVQVTQPVTPTAPGGPTSATVSCGTKCFTVTQRSQPSVTGTAFDTATGRTAGTGKLILTGSGFAKGAKVEFFTPAGVLDDKLTFAVENGATAASGYVSTTQIKGGYTQAAGFVPGPHSMRVTNTDGQTGSTSEFWQPSIGTVAPSRLGQGGSTTVTVTSTPGSAFRVGSRLSIATAASGDLTVGTSTMSADGTSISAPVTVTGSSAPSARNVSVFGPDGGYQTKSGLFTVGAAPTVSGINVPAIGRGATNIPATITGSGFVGTSPTTQFSFGGAGLTAAVQSVSADGTSASVLLTATSDAVVSTAGTGRSITATNPDFGSGTAGQNLDGSWPIKVNAAPVLSDVTPSASARGLTKNLLISGTGFTAPSGSTQNMSVTFSGGGITINGTPAVTKGSGSDPDTIALNISVAPTALAGPRDITLVNLPDKGTSTCTGCFSIDALSVNPGAAANSGVRPITFTADGLDGGSIARLQKVNAPAYQPDIVADSFVPATDGKSGVGQFNLTAVAPGKYNATITTGGVTQSCSLCFTVTGSQPTVTAITPAKGGQGAVSLPVTIDGTNFSRGETVTIGTITVANVVFVSETQLTAELTIAANATVGPNDVKVTNADGAYFGTKTAGFAITAGPKPATIDPANRGQGARNQTVTISGPGFVAPTGTTPGSTVSLGDGVTILTTTVTDTPGTAEAPNPADKIVVTVNVDPAASGARDVVVTNPDAGRGVIANGFTVNPGPMPTSISPSVVKPGDVKDVVILGSNFAEEAVPAIAGVEFSDVAVDDDGNLTAKATVAANAARGTRNLTVTNPDAGIGTCTGCFTITTVPDAPTGLTVTPGDGSAVVRWIAPAQDGGSAISGYTASAGTGTTPVTVAGDQRSATITGLRNNTPYTFTVFAQNAMGNSPTATAPKFATKLTSTRSPVTSVSYAAVIYSGQLTRVADGTPLAGGVVRVLLTPDIGGRRVVNATTNANGAWSFRFNPLYNTTVRATFGGDMDDAGVVATAFRMGVAPRIARNSPASGATSTAGSVLTVKGSIAPNKASRTIGLYSGTRLVGKAAVASNGSFTISLRLPRGTYSLRIGMGATPGNTAGFSPAFTIRRT